MDDIFLKIISGDIPSIKLYEDEHTYAFLDIHPKNKGHALVIPKVRYRNIFDIEPEVFAHMARTALTVAKAVKAVTNADGLNITMNNEPAAGQDVFHAHIHVIPRFHNDNAYVKTRTLSYEDGEAAELGEKIKAALSAA